MQAKLLHVLAEPNFEILNNNWNHIEHKSKVLFNVVPNEDIDS